MQLVDQQIVPHMESHNINQQLLDERPVPPTTNVGRQATSVRHNSPALLLLPFHPVQNRNVKFSDHTVATRAQTEFGQSYVFVPHPIKIGLRLIIRRIGRPRPHLLRPFTSTLICGDVLCFSIKINGEVCISKNGGPHLR